MSSLAAFTGEFYQTFKEEKIQTQNRGDWVR